MGAHISCMSSAKSTAMQPPKPMELGDVLMSYWYSPEVKYSVNNRVLDRH